MKIRPKMKISPNQPEILLYFISTLSFIKLPLTLTVLGRGGLSTKNFPTDTKDTKKIRIVKSL